MKKYYFVQYTAKLSNGRIHTVDVGEFSSLREAVSCAYRCFRGATPENLEQNQSYRVISLDSLGFRLLRSYRYTANGKRRIEKLDYPVPACILED